MHESDLVHNSGCGRSGEAQGVTYNRVVANSKMDPKQLPIRIISKVVRGYGRGSKDLGIPTANVSREDLSCSCGNGFDDLPVGIYWGFARVGEISDSNGDGSVLGKVHIAAISIGYNPTYNNTEKTVEPHLIAPTAHPQRHASCTGETQFQDFYGNTIWLSVVGYLRPELPFEGLEKLTAAIKNDIENTEKLAADPDSTAVVERDWVATFRGLDAKYVQ